MRLGFEFYNRDVLQVAPGLLGKVLVRRFEKGSELGLKVDEVEAYRGEEDFACHAAKGRTRRTEVMYAKAGLVYVYLIYGKYWLLNVVTGKIDQPQAVLIRGTTEINGPGRLGMRLELDRSFYGEDLEVSRRLWIEEGEKVKKEEIELSKRVGVEYSGKWADKLWRFSWKRRR